MATARHPTTEPDDEDSVDVSDPAHDDDDHPGVGIAHPTVVPTNLEDSD